MNSCVPGADLYHIVVYFDEGDWSKGKVK